MDTSLLFLKQVAKAANRREITSLSRSVKNWATLNHLRNYPRTQTSNFCVHRSKYCNYSTKALSLEGKTQPLGKDDPNSYTVRTHTCGELTRLHEGCKVSLFGWIEFIRYDKFLTLRDAYGSTQVLLQYENTSRESMSLNVESVINVEGTVSLRPTDQVNPKMVTGEIEVAAHKLTVLGSAPKQLPFNIRKFQRPTELLSMKYRYLYLRYPFMQNILRIRSSFLHNMRIFLVQKHFVDVETPTLFRRTPGGAQEFVVPTQVPGLFYSLVQSPQQFKQLLMVGGLDRYFQIARCFRDESARPDRQPEFTQLDIELSFVDREGVISLIEELLVACWPGHLQALSAPFPRMSFSDAIASYGCDKPDVRFDSQILDVTKCVETDAAWESQELSGSEVLTLRAMLFRNAGTVCKRNQWEAILKQTQEEWPSSRVFVSRAKEVREISKAFALSRITVENLIANVQAEKEDLIILGCGPSKDVLNMLGTMRVRVANQLEAAGHTVRKDGNHFLWVLDFPLFEEGSGGALNSAHHPFTQPHPDDIHLLDSEPLKVRGLHYDLVLNGAEVGGGSIRISDIEMQKRVLIDFLHIQTETLKHLLDALSMGCPPHGGIALGIDRLVASLCGVSTIREVMAFPKGSNGQDIMSGAPAPLSEEDAKRYHRA